MAADEQGIEDLLTRAAQGDAAARQELLSRHRKRLRQMVTLRLDRRLAARLDPSDVVQEVLTEAWKKMDDYLETRPLPFYPWLRQLAWERLAKLRRRHVQTKKRSVTREDPADILLSDESVLALASQVVVPGSTPSMRILREEALARVHAALARLRPTDREVLVLRYLEQLSVAEVAAVLKITEGAVKVRHLRALQRVRDLLKESQPE